VPDCDPHVVRSRGDLGQQPALADAGRTVDDDRAAPTGREAVECLPHDRKLTVAPHQFDSLPVVHERSRSEDLVEASERKEYGITRM
jgi:hypothetical protein